jgi:hypothetical protein
MATRTVLLGSIISMVCAAQTALSATISLSAAKDNTLYQDAAGALSNGSGASMFAGKIASGGIRRGAIAFDVAGQIPAGSIVTGATLSLHMSQAATNDDRAVTLHRLFKNWGEGASVAPGAGGGGAPAAPGDATWLDTFFALPSDVPWDNAGGDFSPADSASVLVGAVGNYSWTSPALVADVQSWLDNPSGNFGWLIVGDESASSTAKRFDTREISTPALRPALSVTFAPVPEPSSWLLGVIAVLWFLAVGVPGTYRAPA